jgi:HD-GYP domain-containing protein (c-di-GMP phosphodiesterase class II)
VTAAVAKADIYTSFLSGLTSSVNAMRLYPERHPQTQGAIDRCYGALDKAFLEEPEVALLAVDDTVFFNGRPLPGAGPSGEALSVLMRRKGVDRLIFRKGLAKEQLAAFLVNLSSKENTVVYAQSHIQLGQFVLEPDAPRAPDAASSAASGLKLHGQAAAELRSMYDGVSRNRVLSGAEVNAFSLDFLNKFSMAARPMGYLADIKSENEYTYVHAVNVAMLAIGFASNLGLSGKAQADIACAALMHDVGKMFIPEEILNKNGALDPKERTLVELHPVKGALYLGRMGGLPHLAVVAALEHHLKYDGTGYPHIGPERKPHWVSQIVSIADIFDALRSRRPYRDSMELPKVFKLLRENVGTALNPNLVDRFISMVEQRPGA